MFIIDFELITQFPCFKIIFNSFHIFLNDNGENCGKSLFSRMGVIDFMGVQYVVLKTNKLMRLDLYDSTFSRKKKNVTIDFLLSPTFL